VIVQRLTDCVWVGLDSVLNESRIAHVARIFYALKTSLEELRRYYTNLRPTGDPSVATRYFPSITAYRDGDETTHFKYLGFLEDDPSCTAIHAQTCTEPVQDIVVKFVDRYGERAHRILEEEGLAPKLLYCGPLQLDKGQPSYHPLRMVVMEYIYGSTLTAKKSKLNPEATEGVRNEVRRALDHLHHKGLVFGDLRPPNVMITKTNEVKLIDFDWAGERGQARYPYLISPSVSWPDGVKALEIIEVAHDITMLERLLV
jgi:serine/threonine protein kinase